MPFQRRNMNLNLSNNVPARQRGGRNSAALRENAGRLGFAALLLLLPMAGCAVPQPRGDGKLARIVEPTTQRGYWLYLPKDYVSTNDAGRRARHWPLVVTFHGMKPFDNAHPQALEWQQAADRYGFLVIAPELRAPDVLAEFPVKNVHPAFKTDEEATLAILDHVFVNTQADPANVLSTSWSSGGYMAHYMLNRHPDRFTALAVRQSNFSSSILDPSLTPRSRNHPIFIVNTENDFAVCLEESKEAVAWYERNGYKNCAWVRIKALGHERTPDMAADFFGRVCSVQPNRPLEVLAQRQAIDGNARGMGILAGMTTAAVEPSQSQPPPLSSPPSSSPPPLTQKSLYDSPSATPARPVPTPIQPARPSTGMTVRKPPKPEPAMTNNTVNRPVNPKPQELVNSAATPARNAEAPRPAGKDSQVGIRVSSAIGIESLLLGFWAECPTDWQRTADFLWTLNGSPICDGPSGSKTLSEPGEYELGLLVVSSDGQEHRAYRVIRVLPPLTANGSSGGGNNP